MDEQTYAAWWPLHLRVAKGEILDSNEQAVYREGLQCLRNEETLESSLLQLKQTREEIFAMESERERLQERRRQLREQATLLESALSDRAKQLLGIGN